ncbi:MAG TPA: acyl carrier protein [Candidatus Fimenecus stercoravium]|nr:acyl carrier protein [Candidatus Fimenecus stercoravium]
MIFEKVRDIICDQFDVEEDAVTPETLLEEDLDADSLDLVDLVMSFEDEFQIEVPEEEIENIKTVGDIVKYIEEH